MTNVISMDKKIAVLSALVEGCSVRSTVRLTGVSKGAVLRLLVAVGAACTEYHDRVVPTLRLSGSRLMRSGRLSGASKRTSQRPRWKPVSVATFGRSPQLKLRASLSCLGWQDGGTPGVRRSSFGTLQAGWRIESN